MNTRCLVSCTVILISACADVTGTVDDGLHFAEITAGYFHTCGLAVNARAYCWGQNDLGTLGDGTHETRLSATPVFGNLPFKAIDSGAGHTCALTLTGAAWCWGQNDEGQAGDGTFVPRSKPVAVLGGLTFVSISAGHAHSCGVTADGGAYCWGDNSHGQLGDARESTNKSAVPVRVRSDETFEQVIAGYYETCGTTTSSETYCWGLNTEGQIGDATIVDRREPARVVGTRTYAYVAPGDRFVCGLSNSTTWCWGANRRGELGDNAGPDGSVVPLVVSGLPMLNIIATSSGESTVGGAESYGCGARADGRVVCWGGRIRALRGTGVSLLPLEGKVVEAIAAGSQHVCVRTRDDLVYCGGANYAGQLGDGTRTDRSNMVLVR